MYEYMLDSQLLARPSPQKDLGITISKDLKWNFHINQDLSKAYRMLGFLRRHTNIYFDSQTRKLLYVSLVRPHCGYVSEIWAPTSIVNLKKVESIQRRATRYILRKSDLNYGDRLLKMNLLPLSYWHEIKDLVFFFKCIKGLYNFHINNYMSKENNQLDIVIVIAIVIVIVVSWICQYLFVKQSYSKTLILVVSLKFGILYLLTSAAVHQ